MVRVHTSSSSPTPPCPFWLSPFPYLWLLSRAWETFIDLFIRSVPWAHLHPSLLWMLSSLLRLQHSRTRMTWSLCSHSDTHVEPPCLWMPPPSWALTPPSDFPLAQRPSLPRVGANTPQVTLSCTVNVHLSAPSNTLGWLNHLGREGKGQTGKEPLLFNDSLFPHQMWCSSLPPKGGRIGTKHSLNSWCKIQVAIL